MNIKKNVALYLGISIALSSLTTTTYATESILGISEYGPIMDMQTDTSESTPSETTSSSESTTKEPSSSTETTTQTDSRYHATTVNLATLSRDSGSIALGDTVQSKYAAIFDLDENRIVASKGITETIYPASMTKIMTILICAEHVTDLDEKITITQDIVDYVQANDASNCGFVAGEQVTVKDLMYGIIMPSGADAVMALTRHIAGSDAAFVEMMNQKASELGLSSRTHFTNATGLYNANHTTSLQDMAEILNAALKNPTAREILSTKQYTTSITNAHTSGINFSNLFLRRIAGQDTGNAEVLMAKTGYVSQSMFCSASYGVGSDGKHYIVVSGYAPSTWQCIYDQAYIYKTYVN